MLFCMTVAGKELFNLLRSALVFLLRDEEVYMVNMKLKTCSHLA